MNARKPDTVRPAAARHETEGNSRDKTKRTRTFRFPSRSGVTGFMLVELISAMAVLTVLLSCLYATLSGLARVEARYEAESQAVVLMANMVERLGAEKNPTVEAASRILDEEFAGSPLKIDGTYSVRCESTGGRIEAVVLARNGRRLAHVEFRQR